MLPVQQEAFGPVLAKPQVAQEQLLSFTVGGGGISAVFQD